MVISLKAARVNAEYSQSGAAKRLNVSKCTIISWEKGRTAPRAHQLKEISDLYGIPMDHIFLPRTSLKVDLN